MTFQVICKNCDYFNELNPGLDNTGQCRRNPPRGIDEKAVPTGEDLINVFPYIQDGTTEFCGEFKLIKTP